MSLTIELSPAEEAGLEAVTLQEDVAPAELARRWIAEHLPPATNTQDGDPTLSLFARWAEGTPAWRPMR